MIRQALALAALAVYACPTDAQVGDVTLSGWRAIYFESIDPITDAYGLDRLRDVEPMPGRREMRVWSIPPFGGRTLLRLVSTGERVQGEVVASDYWYDREPADSVTLHHRAMVHERLRETCGELRTGVNAVACRARFTDGEPDWPAVLASLEAAGAWILPDERSIPGYRDAVTVDGMSLVVELLDDRYRTYLYQGGGPDSEHPEQRSAAVILELAHRVMRGVDWAR